MTLLEQIKACKNIDSKNKILRGANLEGANLRGANFCICGKWRVSFFESKIKIGCKARTKDSWELFFTGDEIFETRRNTFEFFEIEHNYRWFCEMLKRWPAEFGVNDAGKEE